LVGIVTFSQKRNIPSVVDHSLKCEIISLGYFTVDGFFVYTVIGLFCLRADCNFNILVAVGMSDLW